jgi:DNA repair exonuclease SbcCD ATPase subunit
MINVGKKAKVEIVWNVLPIDYSREKEANIITKMAKKLNLPKEAIRVEPRFITKNDKGEDVSFTNDIITNIQEPKFQLKLFKDYLVNNGIQDYDFQMIVDIDAEINARIDYDVYEKYRKYNVKWLRWDNFMSYGPDNFIDFTSMKGLVLLNGRPANQSGKTTFAIDLLKFLLFGKTKYDTLSEIFNKHLPECTEVKVEGCLEIDGEDYVIRRTVTRPALKRRTEKSKSPQKIEYYKLINGNPEILVDVDNISENKIDENGIKTNKVIKEAIGNEKDFDLTICATAKNLDDLIEFKDTERGRLLSRWIGLLPLEEKDKLARDKFNKEITPKLLSSRYNREALLLENNDHEVNLANIEKDIVEKDNILINNSKEIKNYEQQKDALLSSKKKIDANLLKLDITTVNNTIENIKQNGRKVKLENQNFKAELEGLKDVNFQESEYKKLIELDKNLSIEQSTIKNDIASLKKTNIELKNSEFCPVCKRKFENVNNDDIINNNNKKIQDLINKGVENKKVLDELAGKIVKMEDDREKYNRKLKIELLIEKNNAEIKNLVAQLKDNERLLQDYDNNKDAIDQNNKLDIAIVNINDKLFTFKNYNDRIIREIEGLKNQHEIITNRIKDNEIIIRTIDEEEKLIRNWKIYLEMVGKNGISKVVLRNTLPIINGEIQRLLNGVCDFTAEVEITDKNDVIFNLVADGVKSKLSGGSGFELTCASLALRTVLANISTMPRPNFVVFDELLGRVAAENLENMKLLYDKIAQNYSFIIQISHLESIVDWHDSIITVQKKGRVSALSVNDKQ